MANVNILTTGFDAPHVDQLVILRPTKSLTLHQQMLGRGMRPHEGKENTLVKDFAGNTKRLGTVDDPAPINPPKRGKGGQNPYMKECPDCNAIVHPSVRVCKCGYKFKFKHNLRTTAHTIITKEYKVQSVYYSIHHKAGKPSSVKVSYACGGRVFNEWVLLEHGGYAGYKARYWVERRHKGRLPESCLEFMEIKDELAVPSHITVEEGAKYPKIVMSRFARR